MSLVLDIALTHLRSRLRQTMVGIFGVATGVGFSVMMAALMQGSQDDFVRQLVDSLPHVSITDERRTAPPQPAEAAYDAPRINGLTPEALRPGIKNPLAVMASLESWVQGAVAPSVQARAILTFAGRDVGVTILGIDPRREPKVSQLATQMRQGTLVDLYKASNGLILGDKLAARLGARVGNTITVTPSGGKPVTAQVVGLSHAGVTTIDDNQAYALARTAQVLMAQTGLINQIRVRLDDVMSARAVAARIERQLGYKAVSWEEANEDLLSSFKIRNLIMYTVVGAILLVASFGTYNIVSTITHEKTRDIAIMKSLGFPETTVRRIFVVEAFAIGALGSIVGWMLGYAMCQALGTVEIKLPFGDATRLPLLYTPVHYVLAALVALTASMIAGYFPARKAAATNPVDIIRGAS